VTISFIADFEALADGYTIEDESVDGYFWDTAASQPVATVRNTPLTAPSGTKYVEWVTDASEASIDANPLFTDVNLTIGVPIYLAGFFRFERIGGNDVWADTGADPYQFDKLWEFRDGATFRWGIGVGWNGWYSTGTDHKFTFDAWYSTALIGNQGPDHIVADVAPYDADNPYLCDYETWYGVVLKVTPNTTSSGRVEIWINGTQIINKTQVTCLANPVVNSCYYGGTIGQPAYNTPSHKRQADALLVTDDWQDIIDYGYLGGGGPLAGPTNVHWTPL